MPQIDQRWLKIIDVAQQALQQLSPRVSSFLTRRDLTKLEVQAICNSIDDFCMELTEVIDSMRRFNADQDLISRTLAIKIAFIDLQNKFKNKIFPVDI